MIRALNKKDLLTFLDHVTERLKEEIPQREAKGEDVLQLTMMQVMLNIDKDNMADNMLKEYTQLGLTPKQILDPSAVDCFIQGILEEDFEDDEDEEDEEENSLEQSHQEAPEIRLPNQEEVEAFLEKLIKRIQEEFFIRKERGDNIDRLLLILLTYQTEPEILLESIAEVCEEEEVSSHMLSKEHIIKFFIDGIMSGGMDA